MEWSEIYGIPIYFTIQEKENFILVTVLKNAIKYHYQQVNCSCYNTNYQIYGIPIQCRLNPSYFFKNILSIYICTLIVLTNKIGILVYKYIYLIYFKKSMTDFRNFSLCTRLFFQWFCRNFISLSRIKVRLFFNLNYVLV